MLAGEEEVTLEGVGIHTVGGSHNRLLDGGEQLIGSLREDARVDRNLAPRHDVDPLMGEGVSNERPRRLWVGSRKECHHHPEAIGVDRVESERGEFSGEQSIGKLGHDPGAVPRAVGGSGATVIETDQAFDCEAGHPEGGLEVASCDEADTTRLVFERGVI